MRQTTFNLMTAEFTDISCLFYTEIIAYLPMSCVIGIDANSTIKAIFDGLDRIPNKIWNQWFYSATHETFKLLKKRNIKIPHIALCYRINTIDRALIYRDVLGLLPPDFNEKLIDVIFDHGLQEHYKEIIYECMETHSLRILRRLESVYSDDIIRMIFSKIRYDKHRQHNLNILLGAIRHHPDAKDIVESLVIYKDDIKNPMLRIIMQEINTRYQDNFPGIVRLLYDSIAEDQVDLFDVIIENPNARKHADMCTCLNLTNFQGRFSSRIILNINGSFASDGYSVYRLICRKYNIDIQSTIIRAGKMDDKMMYDILPTDIYSYWLHGNNITQLGKYTTFDEHRFIESCILMTMEADYIMPVSGYALIQNYINGGNYSDNFMKRFDYINKTTYGARFIEDAAQHGMSFDKIISMLSE